MQSWSRAGWAERRARVSASSRRATTRPPCGPRPRLHTTDGIPVHPAPARRSRRAAPLPASPQPPCAGGLRPLPEPRWARLLLEGQHVSLASQTPSRRRGSAPRARGAAPRLGPARPALSQPCARRPPRRPARSPPRTGPAPPPPRRQRLDLNAMRSRQPGTMGRQENGRQSDDVPCPLPSLTDALPATRPLDHH